MTFYLKYRPQTLSELDQEAVRNSLKKVFSSGEVPHAFLFSGPRGTGKTSAARIVAKILNCEKQGYEPCNNCQQCKSITNGESLDVIELDAASHRGIDDVRQIKEAVKMSPVMSRKKVYIVDEAHMLTTEASNALLKTLEEPPSHVVFILATTNPEKLIETIRSRVTNILFNKATVEEVVSSLKRIADSEKIKVTTDSLKLIAKKAEGSFRDGAKILEQVVAELDELTPEAIETFLFNSKAFSPTDFVNLLAGKKTKDALLLLQSAIQKGLSAKDIAKTIIETLRKQLLNEVLGSDSVGLLSKLDLINLIELFTEASSKLPTSFIEEVPLEIAIIKWCMEGKEVGSKKLEVSRADEVENEVKKTTKLAQIKETKLSQELAQKKIEPDVAAKDWKSMDSATWSKVLSSIGSNHASTEALLKAAHPLGFSGNTLKLGVYYKFHKEHLESNAHRRILEEILTTLTGSTVRVICELTDAPDRPSNVNGHATKSAGRDVILSELKSDLSINALTNQKGDDIIDLAEKIFSN